LGYAQRGDFKRGEVVKKGREAKRGGGI